MPLSSAAISLTALARSIRLPSLQSQPPHGFRMRNAFAVAFEPVVRFGDGLPFLFRLGLVINWRVKQGGGNGIDDRLQQTHQRRELRIGQAVNQPVSILAGIGHRQPPESALGKRRAASFMVASATWAARPAYSFA